MIPAVWGAVGGAALVIGALAAMYFDFSVKVLDSVMAFGAGAVFELVQTAFDTSAGAGGVAVGLAEGP